MKSKLSLLMAIVLIAFATTQCRKKKADEPATEDPITPAVSSTTITSIGDVFASHGSANQTFTVNASTATTLNVNGVLVVLPSDAFVTQASASVTGAVTVTVKTILNKKQIMMTGAGANSINSKLVSTKGCVKVTASQNTQSLRLNTTGTVNVIMPDPGGTLPMKKYYASKISTSDSTQTWDLGTDLNDIPIVSISSVNHHCANLDSLKWLNVGALWDSLTVNKGPVIVNTDTIFNKNNCAIYLSINGSLTIGALFQLAPGKFRISNIPNGRGVHIVGIAVKNGQFYSAIMSTITGAAGYNLNMQPIPLAQLLSNLDNIP
jgi:hypothetical protein